MLDRKVAKRKHPLKISMDDTLELLLLTLAQSADDDAMILEFVKHSKSKKCVNWTA